LEQPSAGDAARLIRSAESTRIALGVSVLGLLIFTYASMLMEPPLSKIAALDSNSIGKQVHVQGLVSDVHTFKGGSISVLINDGSGDIDVFVSYYLANSTAPIAKGNILEVIGELDEYQGKLEIKPKNADSMKIFS
jgi:DNA/RNA endonuclease YhcR with UshA esterase domain